MTLLSHSMSTYCAYGQLRDHLLKYIENVKHVWHTDLEKKNRNQNYIKKCEKLNIIKIQKKYISKNGLICFIEITTKYSTKLHMQIDHCQVLWSHYKCHINDQAMGWVLVANHASSGNTRWGMVPWAEIHIEIAEMWKYVRQWKTPGIWVEVWMKHRFSGLIALVCTCGVSMENKMCSHKYEMDQSTLSFSIPWPNENWHLHQIST